MKYTELQKLKLSSLVNLENPVDVEETDLIDSEGEGPCAVVVLQVLPNWKVPGQWIVLCTVQ